jgi:hypothetical protein
MRNDPIVEEIRKVRDRLAAKFSYDVERLGRHYQERQKLEGRKVVRRPAGKVDKEKED